MFSKATLLITWPSIKSFFLRVAHNVVVLLTFSRQPLLITPPTQGIHHIHLSSHISAASIVSHIFLLTLCKWISSAKEKKIMVRLASTARGQYTKEMATFSLHFFITLWDERVWKRLWQPGTLKVLRDIGLHRRKMLEVLQNGLDTYVHTRVCVLVTAKASFVT